MELLFINIVVCFFIGVMGRNRKMGFWGYFFGSLLLTPVIGLLLVLASDDKTKLVTAPMAPTPATAPEPKVVIDTDTSQKQ